MDRGGPVGEWFEGLAGAVTVCDAGGTIVAMNAAALELFAKDGGATLIGSDLRDCHPEPSRTKLSLLMERRGTNAYTIEKNGRFRLILQFPWYRDGVYAGYLEIGTPIESPLPHFVRG
jgi:PAS domain-containing protein